MFFHRFLFVVTFTQLIAMFLFLSILPTLMRLPRINEFPLIEETIRLLPCLFLTLLSRLRSTLVKDKYKRFSKVSRGSRTFLKYQVVYIKIHNMFSHLYFPKYCKRIINNINRTKYICKYNTKESNIRNQSKQTLHIFLN